LSSERTALGDVEMPQSLADLIIHIVFSTKGRHPWIETEVEEELLHRLKRAKIKDNEKYL
jgi:hypothetical protein